MVAALRNAQVNNHRDLFQNRPTNNANSSRQNNPRPQQQAVLSEQASPVRRDSLLQNDPQPDLRVNAQISAMLNQPPQQQQQP